MWNLIMKPIVKLEGEAHIYDTDTQEAKKITTSFRSVWATEWILGQFEIQSKTYSQKMEEEKGRNSIVLYNWYNVNKNSKAIKNGFV